MHDSFHTLFLIIPSRYKRFSNDFAWNWPLPWIMINTIIIPKYTVLSIKVYIWLKNENEKFEKLNFITEKLRYNNYACGKYDSFLSTTKGMEKLLSFPLQRMMQIRKTCILHKWCFYIFSMFTQDFYIYCRDTCVARKILIWTQSQINFIWTHTHKWKKKIKREWIWMIWLNNFSLSFLHLCV